MFEVKLFVLYSEGQACLALNLNHVIVRVISGDSNVIVCVFVRDLHTRHYSVMKCRSKRHLFWLETESHFHVSVTNCVEKSLGFIGGLCSGN